MKRLFDDTLFKRLFLLMWVALVLSHLAGFLSIQQFLPAPDGIGPRGLPPMPSLPPIGDLPMGDGGPPADTTQPGNPLGAWLWLDYAVRGLVIGAAAWFGARWLSAPMRRLADASRSLAQGMGGRQPPPVLDEHGGTLEVRHAAEVFNSMAHRLHEQFDAQALMLAAISHDLRTPLTRLRLRLEQQAPGPDASRNIADLGEMDQLITSVLEMLQLGHERTPPQRVEMTALVQSLVDDLAEQGHAAAVSLEPVDGAAPRVVLGQPAALRRVLDNLIGNAVRHGGSAEVSLHAHGPWLQVQVADRGPGLPADQLEAVFQPFYRVDSSRSRQTGGVGLGLYIARDLARRDGGGVTLSNRPGGGLVAELQLPLMQACPA